MVHQTHRMSLILQGISRQKDIYGNYIFLNVKSGSQELLKLHNSLYRNVFGGQYNKIYVPHMTVGKLDTAEKMEEVYCVLKDMDTVFETTVDKISVEKIGKHGVSIIIIEKEFKGKARADKK